MGLNPLLAHLAKSAKDSGNISLQSSATSFDSEDLPSVRLSNFLSTVLATVGVNQQVEADGVPRLTRMREFTD